MEKNYLLNKIILHVVFEMWVFFFFNWFRFYNQSKMRPYVCVFMRWFVIESKETHLSANQYQSICKRNIFVRLLAIPRFFFLVSPPPCLIEMNVGICMKSIALSAPLFSFCTPSSIIFISKKYFFFLTQRQKKEEISSGKNADFDMIKEDIRLQGGRTRVIQKSPLLFTSCVSSSFSSFSSSKGELSRGPS